MEKRNDIDLFEEFSPETVPGGGSYDSPYLFYNQALEKLKQGSDDMAIILLKKAVASDEFVPQAHLLLALSLYKNKEVSEAKSVLKALLSIDPKNEQARYYMNRLFSNPSKKSTKKKLSLQKVVGPHVVSTDKQKIVQKAKPEKKTKPQQNQSSKNSKRPPEKESKPAAVGKEDEAFKRNQHDMTKDISERIQRKIEERRITPSEPGNGTRVAGIAFLLMIFLAIGSVIGYLVGSGKSDKKVEEAQESILSYQRQIQEYQQKEDRLEKDIEDKEKIIADLNREKTEMEGKLRTLEEEWQNHVMKGQLSQIRSMIDNNEYTAATDALKGIAAGTLNQENKSIYDALYDEAYFGLCTYLYEQGMNSYNNGRYEEALGFFERGIETEYECEYTADFYYRAGRCIYETGDYASCIPFFDVIAQKYSDYQYIDYAYYYTGRAYQFQEEYQKAKEIFIYVRDHFPESPLRESIITRINEINARLD
jgi:tetratricopeptide (TPR) repeat protein